MLDRLRHSTHRKVTPPRQLASQRVAGPAGRAVDGDVQVGIGLLDDDTPVVRQRDPDLATLVKPAARPVDVGKPHGDIADIVVRAIERELGKPEVARP